MYDDDVTLDKTLKPTTVGSEDGARRKDKNKYVKKNDDNGLQITQNYSKYYAKAAKY